MYQVVQIIHLFVKVDINIYKTANKRAMIHTNEILFVAIDQNYL